ncbi:MAG: TIM-barrel domain-containing protein, partial [Candidatus Acidiferrales bacterium]
LKSPLRVIFLDPKGQVILEDHPALPMAWSEAGVRVWKSMAADEHYYGLGEKAGLLDKRNQAYTMWNTDAFGYQESTDPIYKSIPFFLALQNGKAYGIFFDNTYRSQFDFGKESEDYYSFGATGGEMDYYFFYGPHPKQVVQLYGELTGRMPMPPRWALGYQQCRYSYFPEARVREIAATFRQKKIPADVLYLDIDYQKDNAPFTIDRERFPNFEDMINDITAEGFRFIAITDLHLKKEAGYEPYDRGLAGDMFVKNPDGSAYVGVVWPGESVFPDFTMTRAREFWGSLYKDFVDMGISGFWNDMNEPAIFQRADKTMPLDTVHRLDDGTTKDHRAIHNVFGMQNARATYEGLLKLRPNQRPFVLTRAGYAGTQRYAATWTGDNSSTWNHYRMTVPMLLGLGLSGYAMVGNDV